MKVRAKNIFTTVRAEGAILPTDLLQRIVDNDNDLDGLTPAAYHLLEGEKLNEAINRSWSRLRGAWASFQGALERLPESDAATKVTRDRILLPLFQELGYGRLTTTRAIEIEGKAYPISHLWQNTPIHLVGYRVDLDKRTAGVAGAARSSPHSLVQEFLNRSDDHLWAFVSNGRRLRILRDNASLTRQAYVEFDLEAMMAGEVYADFVLLWLLCHQSRVEAEKPEQCWLEVWSKTANDQGKRALEALRDGVESAIASLGQGFLTHSANRTLRHKLQSGELATQDYYRQLLRLVYRLLFLFVAEDRELLLDPNATPAAKDRYTLYYSTARLRTLAEKRRGTRHSDLFHGLRLVMEKLGSEHGCPELALPALGSFLWSSDAVADLLGDSPHPLTPSPKLGEGGQDSQTPLSQDGRGAGDEGEFCQIANADLLDAIRALAFITDKHGRRPVDYKNLQSEELGSVYESLLELHPELNISTGTFSLKTASGNERKTTGSYYTPESLVQCLLDSALDPVVDEAIKSAAALTPQPPLPQGEGEPERWEIPLSTQKKMQEVARQLRRESTPSERILWDALRNRKFAGRKFRRQHPIGTFIVDFFCLEEKLVVEVDGPIHALQQELDQQRQELIESLGLRFVRVSSHLVETDINKTLKQIESAFLPSPSGRGAGGEGNAGSSATSQNPVEEALLNLKICDPACGSGHFLIAAAHRLAKRLAFVRTGDEEPAPEATQTALRDVIGRCIYGVDVNPMAVELCKVALWMEALEPGKPLSFLDHHIQCGNSLLGATPALLRQGIPDDAFKPIEGDDKAYCIKYKKQNKEERKGQLSLLTPDLQPWKRLGDLATSMAQVDGIPDDDYAGVQRKRQQYEAMVQSTPYLFSRFWADAWCAAFVWKKTSEFPYPITEEVFRRIERNPHGVDRWMRDEVERLRDQYRFFHWHLAFPDVFQVGSGELEESEKLGPGWYGGFDVVLGNPPWGSELKAHSGSFYKFRFAEIIVRMVDSCIYFAKLMFDLLSNQGRFGVVLPDGILYQTDSELLRKALLENGDVCQIVNAGDVFEGVSRPAALICGTPSQSNLPVLCSDWTQSEEKISFRVTQAQLLKYPGTVFATRSPESYSILEKILSRPHTILEDILDQYGIQRGVSPDLKDAFLVDSEAIENHNIEKDFLRPVFTGGRDIRRYLASPSTKQLIYTTRKDNFDSLCGIRSYIDTFQNQIKCKEVLLGKHPIYALHRPREKDIFLRNQKIVGVITEDKIVVAVDSKKCFATDAVYILSPQAEYDIYFLAGLLNSKLFTFIYRLYSPEEGRVFAQVKPTVLKTLPVPIIDQDLDHLVSRISRISRDLHEAEKSENADTALLENLVFQIFELDLAEQDFVNGTLGF